MARWDDTDWFRSSRWNDEIAARFEAKLRRARSFSRAQYLRIQGVHLTSQANPHLQEIGRGLLNRVIEQYPDDSEAIYALGDLAQSLTEANQKSAAEQAWRRLLAVKQSPDRGRLVPRSDVEMKLAQLLLERGGPAELREADALLDDGDETMQKSNIFRNLVLEHLVTRARVAAALGDRVRASDFAAEALPVAGECKPSIPWHPTLGRPDASVEIIRELKLLRKPHG